MNSGCFILHRSYSNSFNLSNVGDFFQKLNSKGPCHFSEKEIESRCLVFTSSVRREIRQFQVVVVQRRQDNVQKSVMHVQSCCFSNLNLLLFCRFHYRRRRRRRNPVPPHHSPPPCHATPGVREGPSLYRSLPALRDVERRDRPGLPSSLFTLPICKRDRGDQLGTAENKSS